MNVNIINEKQQEFNGVVYYRCGYYFQKKGKRLHRTVWEHHNGEIPKGLHVHHIDGNRANNQITNLKLIDKSEHQKNHAKEISRIEASRISIEIARKKACEWHGSEEGLKWHSERGKKNWETRTARKYECSFCSKEFETVHMYSENQNHFCSNNCKSAFRRQNKIDNVELVCTYCNKTYMVNKYNKQKCCSVECSRKMRCEK